MIVCCGEALIDFVPALTAGGEASYVARPGGSPFNVAVTLGRLGVSAGFLGSVSTDFFSTRLVEALARSNVDTRYVARLERPSILAFVNLDGPEPQYVFYDQGAAPRFWAPSGDLASDVTTLHLSFGALLPIDDPFGANFAALFAANKGRRILTLDPNVRQNVIGDREHAYRARLASLFELADVVKTSAADLAWLEPGCAPAAAAERWLGQGAALVVVTSGGDGATVYGRGGRTVHCPARKVALVDTVGAGDSFMGAFLAGLEAAGVRTPSNLADIDDAGVASALAFAVHVSAITCSRAGADPPWRYEVTLPEGSSAKGI